MLSQGVKGLGNEVNHSYSSNAEVKNEWSYTSTPHLCLHGVDGDNCLQTETLLLVTFVIAPCINNIKYFIVQLLHSIIQIVGLLKTH